MRVLACLAVVLLVACSKDPSSTIGPDVKNTDGGPLDPSKPDPSKPDPSAPGADTNVSGTRLKRRVYKGTDGSQQFLGWFDTERNASCNFLPAADGKVRCLPSASYVNAYFEDSGCTKPLFFQVKGCTATPTMAYAFVNAATCPLSNPVRVLPVGGPFTGGTVYSGAGCTGSPSAGILGSYDVFTTTTEIPASSFVEATEDHI